MIATTAMIEVTAIMIPRVVRVERNLFAQS